MNADQIADVIAAARQMLLDCRLAGASMEEEAAAWHSLKAKLDALDTTGGGTLAGRNDSAKVADDR